MKRIGSLLGGRVVGALLFGSVLGFIGCGLGHAGEPSVLVRNLTRSPIQVRINTDVGESYALGDIEARGVSSHSDFRTRQAPVGHSDDSNGTDRESERIYVTSQGTVFVAVSEESITIDYEL